MSATAQMPENKKIRCALVHDHVLLRQGLRRLLEDEPDMRVVAETGNAAEALAMVFEQRPEIVIADANIFKGPADQSERLILQESPNSRVLFLTAEQGQGLPPGSAVAGSYAVRQTSAEELVEMVRKTAAASRAGTQELAEWPVDGIVPRSRALTAREREVLKLLAEGRTVRSAAEILGLSIKTVDAHKFNLMRKLGIHNKAELVMWAIQMRVVKLPVNF